MKLLMPQDEGRERRGVPGAVWSSYMQGAATPALGPLPGVLREMQRWERQSSLGPSGPQPC